MATTTNDKNDAIILALKPLGEATAKALDCTVGHLKALAGKGLVEFAGIELGGRGRPAHLYKLTSDGKNLATRLARKAAK